MIPETYGYKHNCRFPVKNRECAVYYLQVKDAMKYMEFVLLLRECGCSKLGNFCYHRATDMVRWHNEMLVIDCLFNFEDVCNKAALMLRESGEDWHDYFDVQELEVPYRYSFEIDWTSVGIHILPASGRKLGEPIPLTRQMMEWYNNGEDIILPEWVEEEINNNKMKHYARKQRKRERNQGRLASWCWPKGHQSEPHTYASAG